MRLNLKNMIRRECAMCLEQAERELGMVDDEGNLLRRKEDEDEERDAWLDSGAGAFYGYLTSETHHPQVVYQPLHRRAVEPVDDKVRERIEARQREANAAETSVGLSQEEIADLQGQVASLLQPGETVVRALKRLGAHSKRAGKVVNC